MSVTVETLTLEMARALEPLRDRLAAGEVEALFSELGLPAPDVVLAAGGVTSAIGDVVDELDDLPDAISDLVDAIEDEDVGAIVEAVGDIAPLIESIVTAITEVADAVETAAGAAGSAGAEVETFATELPERLLGYVLSTYLVRHRPIIAGVAGLLGIIESSPQAATAAAPAHVRRVLRFDRLGPLFEDPAGVLDDAYAWGTSSFDWDLLLQRLSTFATGISPFAFVQTDPLGGPPVLRIGLVDIGITEDTVPGLRADLRAEVAEETGTSIPIADGVAVEFGIGATLATGTAIEIIPPAELNVVPPSAEVSGQARIGVAVTDAGGGERFTFFGIAGGTRLEAGKIRASAGADLSWDTAAGMGTGDFVVEGAVEDGRLVLSLAGADGFLSAILPEGAITVDFDVLAGWSAQKGLYFDGGAALAIDIPVDIDLGAIKIPMLHLGLGLAPDGLELEASGAISAQLGPFAMAVERMGTTAELTFPDGGGNLGPADLTFGFKPPSGIGLSLDAGVVKGGGYLYLDPDAGEYAGVLELAFGPVSIKAIGILTTKLPDGSDGWALLLLVFGEFSAVQLGFGFTLNGVGGIIGLQHGVSIEALQSGLRTGVLDSVLFPKDPVANAPTIIGELRAVFPIVPRALTVGPALKIGWSTPALVTVKLGLVLQFDDVLGAGPGPPSLSRLVLVGQLKVQIPPVDELGIDAPALVQLQVDVVGAYDFDEQALSIDAVLRDSHVAMLPVQGSMTLRARFGDDPTFLLAVGGFHPRFTDIPPGIPPQDRVGISLRYGILTVQITGYVAITSNSFQTGAEASLVAAGGGFRVEAYLGFDALFIFEPVFHFEIDFRLGAAIKYKSISLASVKLQGVLKGPGRWEVAGSATIKVLFVKVSIDFEVAWGDAPAPELPSVAVGPQISAALSEAKAWTAQLPNGDPLVTLRTVDAGTDVMAHPMGVLTGIQRVVPFGIDIDRVGKAKPSDGNRFDIAGVTIGGDPEDPAIRQEHFARGEYLDMTEEEKLSLPSFEHFDAGITVSTDDYSVGADQVAFEPEWETVYLRQDRPNFLSLVPAAILEAQTAQSAVARSELRREGKLLPPGVEKVGVTDATWVTDPVDPASTPAPGTATTYTAAAQAAAGTEEALLVTELAEAAHR